MTRGKGKQKDEFPFVPSSQNGDKELVPKSDDGGADFTGISPTFPCNQSEDTGGMLQSSNESPLSPFGSYIGLADPGPLDNFFQLPEIDWDCCQDLYPDFSATDWNLNACQLQFPESTAPSANSINGLEVSQTDQYSLLSTNDVSGDLQMSRKNVVSYGSDLQSPCLPQNQMTLNDIAPSQWSNTTSRGIGGAGANGFLTTVAQSDGTEMLDGSLLSLEVGDSRGTLSNHAMFNDSIGSGMSFSTHNNGGFPRLSCNLAWSSNIWQNPGGFSQQSQNINDFPGQTNNLGWFCNPTMSDAGLLRYPGNVDVFPSQVQNVAAFGFPRHESDGTLSQVVQQQPSCSLPGFVNSRAMLSRNALLSATNLGTNVHSSPTAPSLPNDMNHMNMHGYGQNGVSMLHSSSLGGINTQSSLDQRCMENFSSEPCFSCPFIGSASRNTSHTQSDNPGGSQAANYIQHTQNVNSVCHASDQMIQTVDGSLPSSGDPHGYVPKRNCTESVPAIPYSQYKRTRTSRSSSLLPPTQSAPLHIAPAGSATIRPSSAQSTTTSGCPTAQTAPFYIPPGGTAPLVPFSAQTAAPFHQLTPRAVLSQAPSASTAQSGLTLAQTTTPFHQLTPRAVLPQASSASTAQSGSILARTFASFHQLTPRAVLTQAPSASTAQSGPTLAQTTPFHQLTRRAVLPRASSASTVKSSPTLPQTTASFHQLTTRAVLPQAPSASAAPPRPSPPLPNSRFCQAVVRTTAPSHRSTPGIVLHQASSDSSMPSHPSPSQIAAPSRPSPPQIAPPISQTVAKTARFSSLPKTIRLAHIKWKGADTTPDPSGKKCHICKRDLSFNPDGPVYQPANPPPVAVLACHHHFHAHCLELITPENQAHDPPCIPCAIGEKN